MKETSTSTSVCELPCCDVTSTTSTTVAVDKRKTAKTYGAKMRHYLTDWEKIYPWLCLYVSYNKAFCFTCRKASHENLATFSHCGKPAFTKNGFNNWKEAVQKFKQHEMCSFHIGCAYRLSNRDNPDKAPVDTLLKNKNTKNNLQDARASWKG